MAYEVLPPFIYLLHLNKNFLFKNLLHISLELARIYCPFAAHWLPPACVYCLFTAHWLFLACDSSYAFITRWLNANWVVLLCSLVTAQKATMMEINERRECMPRKSYYTAQAWWNNEECHLNYPFISYKQNLQNTEKETLKRTMHSHNNIHRCGEREMIGEQHTLVHTLT
jgi:hypothetical protein